MNDSSHPSTAAIELINDVRQYQHQLNSMELTSLESTRHLELLKSKADTALSLLNNSEHLRKALFFLPNSLYMIFRKVELSSVKTSYQYSSIGVVYK